jgi:hypothetical protein
MDIYSFLLGTPNFQGATNTTGPAIVQEVLAAGQSCFSRRRDRRRLRFIPPAAGVSGAHRSPAEAEGTERC